MLTRRLNASFDLVKHYSSKAPKTSAIYLAQERFSRRGELSPAEHHVVSRVIRVDQAGETAANWIYRGQMAIIGKDRALGPVIQASLSATYSLGRP